MNGNNVSMCFESVLNDPNLLNFYILEICGEQFLQFKLYGILLRFRTYNFRELGYPLLMNLHQFLPDLLATQLHILLFPFASPPISRPPVN